MDICIPSEKIETLVAATKRCFGDDCFDPGRSPDDPIPELLSAVAAINTKLLVGQAQEGLVQQYLKFFNALDADDHDDAQEALDGAIHDLFSEPASAKNNEGAEEQIRFILVEGGEELLKKTLVDPIAPSRRPPL